MLINMVKLLEILFIIKMYFSSKKIKLTLVFQTESQSLCVQYTPGIKRRRLSY
jgi:hypothetical protein